MAPQVPFAYEYPLLQVVQVAFAEDVQTRQFVSKQIGWHSPRTRV